ncbi:hypothetical protein DPMN_183499 [Dreissena polymorpha]|uniref:Uncharacterized protein n=1 Tax=Dreissena polymorpha TaxID=45954 RepID=A0A9D4DI85_DREPO|nr:hypothetical protein DPMN_183499 [Dreissena polymorpha]
MVQVYKCVACLTVAIAPVPSKSDRDQLQYLASQTYTLVPVCIMLHCDNVTSVQLSRLLQLNQCMAWQIVTMEPFHCMSDCDHGTST